MPQAYRPIVPQNKHQNKHQDRRQFLQSTAATAAGIALYPYLSTLQAADHQKAPIFKLSLAEWSLHRTFKRDATGKENLKFPVMAKELGFEAVEYVNQFFMQKATDEAYLKELKKICDDQGVKSLLIMVDREGNLGDPNTLKRAQAVKNHYKWVDAAKYLGCHSIRVNARSKGSYDEQLKLAADGLHLLTQYGAKHKINVIVENHGGLSSDGEWLAKVMKKVNHPRCGTLPDFGNFKEYDRYKGTTELMPFAKGVSAKAHDFDEIGNEIHTDFRKMMKIVLDAGYRGYVGVEYEGKKTEEIKGIKLTKALLETVRHEIGCQYT